MKKMIQAAAIGDSHCKVMSLAAEENGVVFRKVMTASFQNFVDASIGQADDGSLSFQMSEFNLGKHKAGDDIAANKVAHRAKNLTVTLNQIVAQKLPVYTNIGMTAVYFVRGLSVAAKENGQDPALMSRKMARIAAEEHFEAYARLYETLVQHVPRVTCFYGPTRFTPELRHIWLAYDEVASHRLATIGVDIIDLRAQLGDQDLRLDPKYHRTSDDDQVHGNSDWGLAVTQAIQTHHQQATDDS